MSNTNFALSILVSSLLSSVSFAATEQTADQAWANDYLTATVTEVADTAVQPTPTPDPMGDLFGNPSGTSGTNLGGTTTTGGGATTGGSESTSCPNTTTGDSWGGGGWGGGFGGGWGGGWGDGKIDLSSILAVGEKVFNFIVTNKPCANYKTLKAAVLPGGTKSFTQLKGWSKPVSKVYRVQFKNMFGKDAGGFSYRIVFVYGGNYQGKGKYIGQISFTPLDIKLKTDRQLNIHTEVLEPLNYGTEEDPLAGVQLLITWSSPTTLRYSMNSIEYFFYGDGNVQDISNGTGSGKLPLH